ncbi:hypothetical protein CAPTEDRAFT_108305, partial [Capitella teleta]
IAAWAKKAHQIAGIIRRTFTHMDTENFTRLFKALVYLHLEYAAPIWSPQT